MHAHTHTHTHTQARRKAEKACEDYYALLGVTEDASDAEIKKETHFFCTTCIAGISIFHARAQTHMHTHAHTHAGLT